jgi:quercetin dioxygenase-like cupin family protein
METEKPAIPDFACARFEDIVSSNPEPGLTRRVGAYNDKLFLAEHHMTKGWSGTSHNHPHDQLVYIVRGHLLVRIGEHAFEMRSGESFVVRGGVEHRATALEESHVVDVFTPCRYDYL